MAVGGENRIKVVRESKKSHRPAQSEQAARGNQRPPHSCRKPLCFLSELHASESM